MGVGVALGGFAVFVLGVTLPGVPVLGAGFLLGGGLGMKGYRAVYAYCMRRGQKALEGIIGAVAVRTRGVWGG